MKLDYRKMLKEAALKVTPVRLAILNLFSEECRPLDAEFIHSKLRNKNTNLVTVYRTLTSLEQAGVLKRVDLHTDSVHYELTAHHHHHIVCIQCGDIESFEMCDLDAFSKSILKKSSKFKQINNHSFELFGICKMCVKK